MKQDPAGVRDRLPRAIDAGLARAEAARLFGVGERTIQRWQHRRRDTGSPPPRPRQRPRLAASPALAARRTDEPALAAVKPRPRRAAARSFDDLLAATGEAIGAATASDARGRDAHRGLPLP